MSTTQLIFLGAPGSGKGTQAHKLASEKGYIHVSTGDLLRSEIGKNTDLGAKVDSILKAGQLVDNETVLELLKSNCDLSKGTYVFDGYPRNLEQAKSLDEVVLKDVPKKAIYFEVDLEKIVTRLTNRRTCKSCGAIWNLKTNPPAQDGSCSKCGNEALFHRTDDKEDTVRERLSVFADTIAPMLSYYESQNELVRLDASDDINETYKNILELVK